MCDCLALSVHRGCCSSCIIDIGESEGDSCMSPVSSCAVGNQSVTLARCGDAHILIQVCCGDGQSVLSTQGDEVVTDHSNFDSGQVKV